MVTPNTKRMYGGVFIGYGIRRQIGKTTIFRIRRGNGFYGAIDGEIYQDKYDYFVPTSITDAAGDASRTCFTNAVNAWQALSTAEKIVWDKRAQKIRYMSGFNLYIRNYMERNY